MRAWRSPDTKTRAHEDKRLRLRLHVDAQAPAELHRYQWERIYDPETNIALACSRETAFSRYLGRDALAVKPISGRLRFLVVLSCPSNLDDYGLPLISREQMREPIERS